MGQEINEVAVEMNAIFDNMSLELLNKIPLKIREFFKNNASTTYNFKYDTTKSLNAQNLKDKTRGVIALLYRDYICDDVERKKYNEIYTEFLNKKEAEKRARYNPDDIFKKTDTENYQDSHENEITNNLQVINDKPNIIKRIINKILNLFK